nr:hypothetical protein [Tanacetum cinerariifolium]
GCGDYAIDGGCHGRVIVYEGDDEGDGGGCREDGGTAKQTPLRCCLGSQTAGGCGDYAIDGGCHGRVIVYEGDDEGDGGGCREDGGTG